MTELRKQIESIFDAEQEAAKLRNRVADRQKRLKSGSLLFGSKAGVMGEPITAFHKDGSQQKRDKIAAEAFDHVQNLDEQRAETEEERARRGRKAVKEFGR